MKCKVPCVDLYASVEEETCGWLYVRCLNPYPSTPRIYLTSSRYKFIEYASNVIIGLRGGKSIVRGIVRCLQARFDATLHSPLRIYPPPRSSNPNLIAAAESCTQNVITSSTRLNLERVLTPRRPICGRSFSHSSFLFDVAVLLIRGPPVASKNYLVRGMIVMQ